MHPKACTAQERTSGEGSFNAARSAPVAASNLPSPGQALLKLYARTSAACPRTAGASLLSATMWTAASQGARSPCQASAWRMPWRTSGRVWVSSSASRRVVVVGSPESRFDASRTSAPSWPQSATNAAPRSSGDRGTRFVTSRPACLCRQHWNRTSQGGNAGTVCHPAPCTPAQTHCDTEFTEDPMFRVLDLGLQVVVGAGCGLAAWAIMATVARITGLPRRHHPD